MLASAEKTTLTVLYWNVKYFGATSPNFQERCKNLAEIISRHNPDIAAFVELTSTAPATLVEISKQLTTGKKQYSKPILFEAGGGNKEHYGVFLSTAFGLGNKMSEGGARVGAGTRKVGMIAFSNPPWTFYLCHPSPCDFTEKVAIKDASSIVKSHAGPAVMVGDFNASNFEGFGAAPAASTFQSQASGSLKTLDGAIFNSHIDVKVIKSERVTKEIDSDHAWILFEVSF